MRNSSKIYPSNSFFGSRLRWAWHWARAGVLILPLIPALGEVGLVVALVSAWKQQFRSLIRSPLNWGLAIFSIWLIVNACIAFYPTEAFLGLANFLPFFCLFAAFRRIIQTPSQLRQLAWLITIPSLPIVVLGLGQLFGGWATPDGFQYIFGWKLVAHGEPPGRMSSVFIWANFLAAYVVIVFALGLGLWINTYQGWRRKTERGWVLLLLTLVVIGNGVGIILSNSRSAWAIACLVCLAFALYLGWYWLVLGVAAAAGSILWAAFGTVGRESLRHLIPAFFWARLTDQLYPDRPLPSLRVTQWQFAWEMTQQRPWTGWGLRNFTPLYQERMNWWLGHPHNLFLMLTAEIGIPATLLLVGLVGWVLLKAIGRMIRTASTQATQLLLFTYVVAFGSCILFNLLDVTLYDLRLNTLSWLLLSAICGVGHNALRG